MRDWKKLRSLLIAQLLALLWVIHRIAIRVDNWIYPGLREVRIVKPLFIVGLPRSGTTLLHRLIASDTKTFTTFPLWELLLAPALCEKHCIRTLGFLDRLVGSPGARVLRWVERKASGSLNSIHQTGFNSPEEDYLSLLPYGGCFLQVIMSPLDPKVWRLAYFSTRLNAEEQKRLLEIYKGILKRHLYFRGTDLRLLSKNPALTSWLPALVDEFEDARFVGLRRRENEAVPSQLSSIRSAMQFFGNDVTDPRVVRLFASLLADYSETLERAARTHEPDRLQIVEYDRLTGDSFSVVCHLLRQFGYALSEQGRHALAEICTQQREYRSTHRYDLADFGLDEQQLATLFKRKIKPTPSERVALPIGVT